LIITKRDWERAWEKVFGRFRQQPVVVERTEQVSRLFEAKKRALSEQPEQNQVPSTQKMTQEPQGKPSFAAQEQQSEKPKPSEAPPKQPKASPGVSGSLASRLLAKKREQQSDKDE
jgi:hypothetical protein